MALEPILGELERQAGRGEWMRRDPDLYWFAIFGDPGDDRPWSWRMGGHHVAMQSTVADGRVRRRGAVVPRGEPGDRARRPARRPPGDRRRGSDSPGPCWPVPVAGPAAIAVVDPVAPPDI